jgi:anaerobic ribonucleoside-triphosphate reductase activating protein
VLVFSGMTIDEIGHDPIIAECLNYIDVLIAGQYEQHHKVSKSLIGSSNQKIHLLTDRYSVMDFDLPESEISISADGTVIITGIDPVIIDN